MSTWQFVCVMVALGMFIAVQVDGLRVASFAAALRVGKRVLKANQRLWGRNGWRTIPSVALYLPFGERRGTKRADERQQSFEFGVEEPSRG